MNFSVEQLAKSLETIFTDSDIEGILIGVLSQGQVLIPKASERQGRRSASAVDTLMKNTTGMFTTWSAYIQRKGGWVKIGDYAVPVVISLIQLLESKGRTQKTETDKSLTAFGGDALMLTICDPALGSGILIHRKV
jgi:hypothetical protein